MSSSSSSVTPAPAGAAVTPRGSPSIMSSERATKRELELEEKLRNKEEQCRHLSDRLSATSSWLSSAFPSPSITLSAVQQPTSELSALPPLLQLQHFSLSPSLLSLFHSMSHRISSLTSENALLSRELDIERFDPSLGAAILEDPSSPTATQAAPIDVKGKGKELAMSLEERRVFSRRLVEKLVDLTKENDLLGKELSRGEVARLKEEITTLRRLLKEYEGRQIESDALLSSLDQELESLSLHTFALQTSINTYQTVYGPVPPTSQPSTSTMHLSPDLNTSREIIGSPSSASMSLSGSTYYLAHENWDGDPNHAADRTNDTSHEDLAGEFEGDLEGEEETEVAGPSGRREPGTGKKARRNRRRKEEIASGVVGMISGSVGSSARDGQAGPSRSPGESTAPGLAAAPPRAPQAMLRKVIPGARSPTGSGAGGASQQQGRGGSPSIERGGGRGRRGRRRGA